MSKDLLEGYEGRVSGPVRPFGFELDVKELNRIYTSMRPTGDRQVGRVPQLDQLRQAQPVGIPLRAIRACEKDLLWVAKHFSKKGLEPLSDEVTGDRFTSVRILCGPSNVTHKMRYDFERFKEEMENRHVDAELRVMTDQKHLDKLHDRWLLSDGNSWNVPPVNSLYRNQEAELHKVTEDISFEEWWDDAADIISDWNAIQKHI